VDLQSGILSVREPKFGKSRFLPVEESTCAGLARYATTRDGWRRATEAFLVSERGERLHTCATSRMFASMSFTVGLRVPPESRRIGRAKAPEFSVQFRDIETHRVITWRP
jgi:site-specific recombinase XerC